MNVATTGDPGGRADAGEPYRVLVVDDSAVVRSLLRRILQDHPQIQVCGFCINGKDALAAVLEKRPDVVVMDIEMPVMDGITALAEMIRATPTLKVIMASTLTRRNAEISLKAMSLGASDYIPKPESKADIEGDDGFRSELVRKVRALGEAARHESGAALPAGQPAPAGDVASPKRARPFVMPHPGTPISLRKPSGKRPGVVAVGSSTGGPNALLEVLGNLPDSVRQPVLITQHMPATFTKILAGHIANASGRECVEGADGMKVEGGRMYLAPGGWHMTVEGDPTNAVIRLNQNPPENFCRPAVDPMLRSIVSIWGGSTLTVILTGMGQDGLLGCEDVVKAGGTVVTQDAETSVVWGMPGVVSAAGLSSAVLPIEKIAGHIGAIVTGAVT